MGNDLQIFKNSEFGEIGILEIDGKEWFPATVCARILGYTNPRKALSDHCNEKGVTKCDVLTNGGTQSVKFISEGNLYRLIVRSKLPSAERFERWVFDEVLPSIKKNGGYGITPQTEVLNQMICAIGEISKTVTELSKTVALLSEKSEKDNAYPQIMDGLYIRSTSKIENFPAELLEQVDHMLSEMQKHQRTNFSLISRFCTLSGYSISSPAVKRYFDRKFK